MIVGVRESAFLNKVFTLFNIIALSFMIIAGATRANPANWHIDITVCYFMKKIYQYKRDVSFCFSRVKLG